jgi:hypothetical protein
LVLTTRSVDARMRAVHALADVAVMEALATPRHGALAALRRARTAAS